MQSDKTGRAEVIHKSLDEIFFARGPKVQNQDELKRFLNEKGDEFHFFRSKVTGIESILKTENQNLILSAYGLGYGGPPKLASLCFSLKSLLDHSASLSNGLGSVVIPLLSNLNEQEWNEFHKGIKEWGSKLGESIVPKILDISDPNLPNLLHLKKGEIAIVKVGMIPQEVMELLFQKSSLPPLVAGTASGSFLQSIGKPYLSTVSVAQQRHDRSEPWNPQFVEASEALSEVNASENETQLKSQIEKIRRFYQEALSEESQLNRDFAKVGEVTRSKGDSLFLSLARFHQFVSTGCISQKIKELF